MKSKTSITAHIQIGLIVIAGIVALALALQGSLAATVKACYFAYGVSFLFGSLAYYTRPRIGSTVLIVSLLSLTIVAHLVGFPVWVNSSMASRVGLVIGSIAAAGIVTEPLLGSRDGANMPDQEAPTSGCVKRRI